MKNLKSQILLLCLTFLSSCALLNDNTLYDAPTVPIPLLQTKNDCKIKAGYGFFTGLQSNASYGLTNKFAVIGAVNYNNQTWSSLEMGLLSSKTFRSKNHSFETGFGFFLPLKSDLVNTIEIYAGTSFGKENKNIRFSVMPNYHGVNGNFNKYFIQVNIGSVEAKEEFGFANRFSILSYKKLNYFDVSDNYSINLDNTTIFYWEPVFMYAYGSERIKFEVDLGGSAPIVSYTAGEKNYYRKGSVIFNAGVNLNIGKLVKNP